MGLTRVFIHGLESSSQGTKGEFFRTRYQDMIIEDYIGTFQERMNRLNAILSDKNDLILVGSSYGGLMAAVFANSNEGKMKKLILLAPAIHLDEFKPYSNKKLHIPVILYHGIHDDVVSPEAVRDIAFTAFPNLEYYSVDDDHSLHNTFTLMDWDKLLEIQ